MMAISIHMKRKEEENVNAILKNYFKQKLLVIMLLLYIILAQFAEMRNT